MCQNNLYFQFNCLVTAFSFINKNKKMPLMDELQISTTVLFFFNAERQES